MRNVRTSLLCLSGAASAAWVTCAITAGCSSTSISPGQTNLPDGTVEATVNEGGENDAATGGSTDAGPMSDADSGAVLPGDSSTTDARTFDGGPLGFPAVLTSA